MSGYRPPSSPAAVPPPNRNANPKPRNTLVRWAVLIAIFAALYNFFAPPPGAQHAAPVVEQKHAEPADPVPKGPPALMLLPVAVAVALAGWLRSLRLDPKEIPFLAAPPAPAPPADPPPPSHEPVRLEGKANGAKASLTLELSGVRWECDGRLLSSPQAMEVPWVDVEALTFVTTAPMRVWAIVLGLVGLVYGVTDPLRGWAIAAGLVGAALLAWIVGGRVRTTHVSLVTRTHLLQLDGRAPLGAQEEAALAALYQHRPELKRPKGVGLVAYYKGELRALFASDQALERELRENATTPPSPEDMARSVRVRRALAVWSTGWTMWLPMSIALAWSLTSALSPIALVPFVVGSAVGSFVGLVLSGKLLGVLSWLTNIPIVKQAPAQPATN